MREITNVTRTKKTFQLTDEEFYKGDWIKEVPKSHKVEIIYTANNGILVIKDMPFVKSVKENNKGEQNGRKNE